MATEAYRDLRSASRTKHRERARKVKYDSFRIIKASDLPSKPKSTSQPPHTQQEHYLPICLCTQCPWEGTTKTLMCATFPADLSTAPIAKFTPREAYQVASYSPYRQQRHHADKHKDFPKQARQRHFKSLAKREIREDPQWKDSCFDERMVDDEIDGMDESEQYLVFGKRPELFEVWAPFTEHGETLRRWCEARGTTPGEHWKQYLATKPRWKRGTYWEGSEFLWGWYRNITGSWEFNQWGSCCDYCDSLQSEEDRWGDWTPEGPQSYSLARWCKGMLKQGVLWEEEEEEEEDDWDVVSVASSAWMEIEELEDVELEFVK
jgi:hypothetical protein